MNAHAPHARKNMDVMTFVVALSFVVIALAFAAYAMHDVMPHIHAFLETLAHPQTTSAH
jgi:preprotein translocase subunit SecG